MDAADRLEDDRERREELAAPEKTAASFSGVTPRFAPGGTSYYPKLTKIPVSYLKKSVWRLKVPQGSGGREAVVYQPGDRVTLN
jgi:hypothetical protein